MKSERLKKIEAENEKYEQEAPFNFCNRWCARCIYEKQMRCKLYQDELEQKLNCIAHGKDENDWEITEQVMRRQFDDMEKRIQNSIDERGIDFYSDFDQEDFNASEEITNPQKPLNDDALVAAANEYLRRAHEFLKVAFFDKNTFATRLTGDFETVTWYHTLLAVKLQRALSGFGVLDDDDEEGFALNDSVAQFAVCQKAIKESIEALRNIQPDYPMQKTIIVQLFALLTNMAHRIKKLEQSI